MTNRELYLSYVNDFLTVAKFAEHYRLEESFARELIAEQRKREPESVRGLLANVKRTKMGGGGNCYEVRWSRDQKPFKPLAFGNYATVCVIDGTEYYSTRDMLRIETETESKLEGQERAAYFELIDKIAARVDSELLARAFPECRNNFDPNKLVHPTNKRSTTAKLFYK